MYAPLLNGTLPQAWENAMCVTEEGLPMDVACTYSRQQLTHAFRAYLDTHPELSGIRDMALVVGISYDALRKYANGSNIPPADKWALLQPVLSPYLATINGAGESLFKPNEGSGNMDRNAESSKLEQQQEAVVQKLLEVSPDDRTETTPEQRQEMFIPIHGFVWFYPEEMEIIDHPAFQRLSGLHQLGLAYFVFRGATHRRFEHVLGTVGVAQRMLEAVAHNCKKTRTPSSKTQWLLGQEPTKWEQRFIRLAALLHDIGHLPYGHTFEDELHLLGKHDEEARLSLVFEKSRWYGAEYTESLSARINRLYSKYVPPELEDRYRAADIVKQIILKPLAGTPVDSQGKIDQDLLKDLSKQNETEDKLARAGLRVSVCRDIVGNTICADILDYLHRDWYHVGKPRHFDERILHYMEIRTPEDEQSSARKIRTTPKDVFVISLGRRPKLRTDGVSEIMALLESRYQLSETVLFHRTKMKATAMLERALSLALPADQAMEVNRTSESSDLNNSLEGWLLEHPEEALLPALIERTGLFDPSNFSPTRRESLDCASRIASKLFRRDLYDELWTLTYDELSPKAEPIQAKFGDDDSASHNRGTALSLLERDFGLPRGSIAMYSPESRMNSKVARVRILVEDTILPFMEYESKFNNQLSGGHLKAQVTRFEQLWRIGFFIDPETKVRIGSFLGELKEAISILVLGQPPTYGSVEDWTQRLVSRLVQFPTFHLYQSIPLSEPRKVGAARQAGVVEQYPMGGPSLLNFFADGVAKTNP